MSKAIVLVLDSLGIGASADAAVFGDTGADTLRHIAQACARGEADGHCAGGRCGCQIWVAWAWAPPPRPAATDRCRATGATLPRSAPTAMRANNPQARTHRPGIGK